MSFFKLTPSPDDKFKDLLINTETRHKLYEDGINAIHPNGMSEIIVQNMKMALKLTKIAVINFTEKE